MEKMRKQKPTGRATSVPTGLAWGVISALVTVFLGTGIAAKLIDLEIITWNNAGYLILAYLMLSAWIGGVVSFHKIKRRKAAVCIISGMLFLLALLIITALFFGGQYSGVGETALLIFAGSMLAFFTGGSGKRRKMRAYNR